MSLLSSGCKFNLAVQVLATKWRFQPGNMASIPPDSLVLSSCCVNLQSPLPPAVPWVANAGGCYSGTFRHNFYAQGWQLKGTGALSLIDVVIASAPKSATSPRLPLHTTTDTFTPASWCLTLLTSSGMLVWLHAVLCKFWFYANCLWYANQCIK